MRIRIIPSPCKKDCVERKCHCQLNCKKYKIYEKIKLYQDRINCNLYILKIENEISWEDKI